MDYPGFRRYVWKIMQKYTREEKYMNEALKQAKKAAAMGEVPIGCVIVMGDKIIGRGYNRRKNDHTTLAHAEIIAIRKACRAMGDWRLDDAEMYVTLEPCQMCSGAVIQARIRKLYIGAMNPKAGCAGSLINIFEVPGFNHYVELHYGILQDRCSQILKDFFKEMRARVRAEKAEAASVNDGSTVPDCCAEASDCGLT